MPKKIWDQKVLFLKCGYPLYRGATKVGFHCTITHRINGEREGCTKLKLDTGFFNLRNMRKSLFPLAQTTKSPP